MPKFSFEIPSLQPFHNNPLRSMDELPGAITELRLIPARFREVAGELSDRQLDTKTEKGVWTVRQVIHHTADSHLNAFIRFKFALTLDSPEIMPYPESLWAGFPDSLTSPVENSLNILDGIHNRWADTLSFLTPEQIERKYYHPEDKIYISIALQVPLYIWHGNYHLGFIMRTLE